MNKKMKVITKLFIPSSMDDTLRAKIAEAQSYLADEMFQKVAVQNCITYARMQIQAAFLLGIEQGKTEAIAALREELEENV